MELLCIQSQEHPELPQCELKAVIECEEMETSLDVITEGLVILKDISEEFNISQSRISRIIQNALDKIKKELLKQEELDENSI